MGANLTRSLSRMQVDKTGGRYRTYAIICKVAEYTVGEKAKLIGKLRHVSGAGCACRAWRLVVSRLPG